MKVFWKILIGFVVVILLLVVLPIVIFTIMFTNNTRDSSVYDTYDVSKTSNMIIEETLQEGFDTLGEKYALDLNLDQNRLNSLVFAIIRENVNSEYDPKNGTTDEQKYINTTTIPNDVPVVGGKKLLVDEACCVVDGDLLTFSVGLDCFDTIKTKLQIGLKMKSNEEKYELTVDTLKLGKMNLLGGLGKKVFDLLLDKNVISKDSIDASFKDSGLPFTIDMKTMTIIATKQDMSDYLQKQIQTDSTDQLSKDLISILTDPKNNVINLNIIDNKIAFNGNLELLKVDDAQLVVDENIKEPFNNELFIKNKTQTFALNALSTGQNKIIFTYDEFNKLIYNQTNGYEDLTIETEIMGDLKAEIKFEGLILSEKNNKVNLRAVLNINGLRTTALVDFDINKISDSEIHLVMNETVTLGKNSSLDSSFLNSILSESMSDFVVMKYDGDSKSFIITSNLFSSFLSEAGVSSSLSVTKIDMTSFGLEIYTSFTDPLITGTLNIVTNKLEDILGGDFFDQSKLNNENGQGEIINKVMSDLADIKEALADPETVLNEELTNSLIESIGNLSNENQEEFLNQLQDSFTSSDLGTLNQLYGQLFG